ncbi:MAG: hypothetical protein Q7J73_07270 [Dehalococcoidales bacterium]|nr:hypothetical protein [Dehalococcoidales bacterium]
MANFAPAATAAETAWNAGYQLEYTDNAGLTPNNQQEEWANVLNAGVSMLENSPSLDAKVQAQASYRNYKNNVFPDDTVFGLGANVLWKISPDRFHWTVEDYLTQTSVLSLGADTPSNRQKLNVFSTGPDFKVRLSPVQALQFGARYTRNTYGTSDLDNARHAGELKWVYESSPVTSLSLNYIAQTVRYDDVVINTDFDRQDAFLQIENRLSRNIFVLSAGATSIQRENMPDEEGSLGRFSWTRLVSPVSTFNLSATSELSDVGRQALATGQTVSANQQGIPVGSNTGNVFRTNSVIATFNHRRSFGKDSISLFKAKDEYSLSSVVEERKGGSIDIGYEFAGTRAASVFARYTKTESNINTPATEFKDKNYGLRFSDRFARNFTAGLELGRNIRDNVNISESYTERHAILTLSYTASSNSGTSIFKQ